MNQNFFNPLYVQPEEPLIVPNEEPEYVDLDFTKIATIVDDKKKPTLEVDTFVKYKEKLDSMPVEEKTYIDGPDVDVLTDCNGIINMLNNNLEQPSNVFNVLMENYSYILEEMIDNGNKKLLNSFTQPHVLNIMGQVLYNVQLTPKERVYCNKIVYDFLTIKDINMSAKDIEAVRGSMLVFGKIVNRDIIPQLMTLNISEDLAANMTIARYSSSKDIVNVKRLNVIIVNQPADFMTEEMIINIYGKLFTSATSLTEGILFDVWSDSDLDTEDKLEVYATINLALLSILNDLNSNVMNQVLHNFLQDKSLVYTGNPIRFNLKSFADNDFPRLKQMLDYIDNTDGEQRYV